MLRILVYASLICLVLGRPADSNAPSHSGSLEDILPLTKRQRVNPFDLPSPVKPLESLSSPYSNSSSTRPTGSRTRPSRSRSSQTPKATSSPTTGTGDLIADSTKKWDAKAKTHSFQIILSAVPDVKRDAHSVTPDVDVYDVDLFMTSKDVIQNMKRLNKTVICYFSGGTYEPGRPDSSRFATLDQGSRLPEWPREKWLKLGSQNVRRIMADRIQLASQKGCDAIDPDNVDGYTATLSGGAGATKAEAIDFVKFLAETAKKFGMATGLKNAMGIIREVGPSVHFAVNEQCASKKECNTYATFKKPIFHIEYPPGTVRGPPSDSIKRRYCFNNDPTISQYFHTVLKGKNLDGAVQYCDGQYAKTPTRDGDGGRTRSKFIDEDSPWSKGESTELELPTGGSFKAWQNDPEAIQIQADLAASDGYPFPPGKGSESLISDVDLFRGFLID